jgi:iron complex outermembrane recepter protein
VNGAVDPQFNSGWLYGNYLVTAGSFDVKEFFAETVVPLAKGLDFNGAIRQTDYSTSGSVTTWKLGATWQMIDDFKLRVVRSRDIRAPNLSELFAPGTARTNTVNVAQPGGGQRTDQFTEQTTGNNALKPEVALTWGIGGVFTPSFLPGFAASVDFFDIKLGGAIGTLTAQTITTLCIEQNRADICPFITFNGPVGPASPITGIKLVPFNFAQVKVRGVDLEASYRFDLGGGKATLRALASHYIDNITNNGVDVPEDVAGKNQGDGVPSWNYRLTANYEIDSWGFNLVGRGISGGVYNNNFIECTSGCPVSTAAARTINTNRISGQWFVDASITKKLKLGNSKAEFFLYVRNLLNSDPVLVGNGPTGNNTPAYPQTNRALYDVLGRVYRMGVRFEY